MKFSKISGWFLLTILSFCISACSSDSDKGDTPTPPEDSSDIIGYWHYIDDGEEGFYDFRNGNVLNWYVLDEGGLEILNCWYYLDMSKNKLLIWYEANDYDVYEIRMISNSAFNMAWYDSDITDVFGSWNKFDVATAKKCIDYVQNNSFDTESAVRYSRSSKSELENWINKNS